MSYPRQTTFETSTQMSSITFRIYHPWLIPNLFQSEILSSFEKVKILKSFTYISEKNSNSLTRHRCDRYRPRFFDQVGHQTMYASMRNKHFFTISCHHQTYQNYEQSRQKLGTFLENKVLSKSKFSKKCFYVFVTIGI